MAEEQNNSTNDLNSTKSNTYTKGLYKDYNDSYVPEGVWINAVNAVTNSHLGDFGTIGNEPSNKYCTATNFDVIGIVRRNATTWFICSTNDTVSEIGIFNETDCSYVKHVSSICLGFKKSNLITGVTQVNYDCTYTFYFADGLNPDRAINLDKLPLKIEKYDNTNIDCPEPIYYDPPILDCDKTRLHYLVDLPCYSIEKSNSAGTLFNGSYQVVVAYSINGLRVSNYFMPSNTIAIWDHENNGGSIDLVLTEIDTNFEEYEVVLISTINSTTAAKRVGFFSTSQTKVHIDNNNDILVQIPLEDIPINQTIYETSDKMFLLNFYLLRTGLSSKADFNYQPLANQIVAKWVQVEYPADYYIKGNNETGYMRDEIYSFFIRWVYKTGDKSASYHIPGRPIKVNWDDVLVGGPDVLPYDNNNAPNAPKWRVYNTATTLSGSGVLPDGGKIVNKGYMAYWQSEVRYPNKPRIWNCSEYPWSTITVPPYPFAGAPYSDYDLCGQYIRHHKFPDDVIAPIYTATNNTIQLLGIQFDNIKPPLDENGDVIKSIVGYEILRGSRTGNKTIIAKGLINNMVEYNVPTQPGALGLFQNYPYNSLEPDYFLRQNAWFNASSPQDYDNTGNPINNFKRDYFTFHTPDFNFRGTYLNPNEVRIYAEYNGTSNGTFVQPFGHPKHKIPSQGAFVGCLILGLGTAIYKLTGKKSTTKGNNRSISGGLVTAAVAAAGLTGGAASGAATTILGGTGFGGGTVAGFTNGSFSNINLPTVYNEGNEINTLNPFRQKPGIENDILSFITQMAMVLTIGSFLLAQGFGEAMKLIMELLPWRQYALQYNSSGLYSTTKAPQINNFRRQIASARYIQSGVQIFDSTYVVNNLYRPNAAMFKTIGTIADPKTKDASRKTVSQLKAWTTTSNNFISTISSYYAGLKLDLKSAYSQLSSITQIPVSNCVSKINYTKGYAHTSPVYFRGDVYINRYTEKNTFPLFNQWLYDFPNGTDFDYKLYANIPYPRYWAIFEDLDLNEVSINQNTFPKLNQNPFNFMKDFANKFGKFVTNPIQTIASWVYGPSKQFHLDRNPSDYTINLTDFFKKSFYIKNGYFYLFVNGVRDFYCESEINLSSRDYGTLPSEQFYNPVGNNNLYELFKTNLVTVPEFFKYDYSLSVSRSAIFNTSWSSVLPRSYDPDIPTSCFEYYPNRLIYSLQQQYEQSRDNWRIYLNNNYKDFENKISNIKSINRTGSVILFEDAIPTTINGVDELQTSTGNRITVGDAGLFNQPFQSLTNSDLELEYGSCQSTRSVINTTYGVFWMNQKNGKIMQLAGNQIIDISMNGMRYWFAQNLPYNILQSFPEYDLLDNPVKGVGCQTAYDNQFEIIYFCKKDYKLLPNIKVGTDIIYIPEKKGFQVTAYSYDFVVTYNNPLAILQSGYKMGGNINGYDLQQCTYTATIPTETGIISFVNCLTSEIKKAPNIKNVFFSIQDTGFKVNITLKDTKLPANISISIINNFISTDINVNENNIALIDLNDSNYFEDCSWTISYDPKTKMWLSFHDWHPDLVFSSNDHFYTIKDNGFWKHNVLWDSYTNYYGVNYGWEIEFPVNTGATITTIKSIEYYLEVFKYNTGSADRYHVLDGNFDQAMIYNTEQTSGLLNLHIKPKNNPIALINYPEITPIGINIHVAKEENKYRFNQFWDVTKDRGEFDGLQSTNFITECNGYTKNINPQAVDYFKSPLQRKKFRHYGNRVILRKLRSGAEKMNLKVVITKETFSPR